MENASAADREELRAIYAKDDLTDDDVARASTLLERAGARSHSQETASRYAAEALDSSTPSTSSPRAAATWSFSPTTSSTAKPDHALLPARRVAASVPDPPPRNRRTPPASRLALPCPNH